jgi:hypothetical protein
MEQRLLTVMPSNIGVFQRAGSFLTRRPHRTSVRSRRCAAVTAATTPTRPAGAILDTCSLACEKRAWLSRRRSQAHPIGCPCPCVRAADGARSRHGPDRLRYPGSRDCSDRDPPWGAAAAGGQPAPARAPRCRGNGGGERSRASPRAGASAYPAAQPPPAQPQAAQQKPEPEQQEQQREQQAPPAPARQQAQQ